jgi:hypothetical protein
VAVESRSILSMFFKTPKGIHHACAAAGMEMECSVDGAMDGRFRSLQDCNNSPYVPSCREHLPQTRMDEWGFVRSRGHYSNRPELTPATHTGARCAYD